MKASLEWIRYLNDKYQCAAEPAPAGADALVEKIGAQLGAVEEVINLGKKYGGILIVKIVSCQKHPNADQLSICLVDDGGENKKVKRTKEGLIEVVCGAPNAKAGILAAWIPPGSSVPSTYDKEPFVLEAREIRGVVSNGMLASAKELALGDDHSTIVEVDPDIKPGSSFAEIYRLNDYIIDIENKMFTHRPDLFGQLGIAREIAGIQHHAFKSPSWYKEDAAVPSSNARDDHKLTVKNEVPKLVPRFCAIVIKGVKVKPSPIFIQARLASVGIRSINNIVDLSNLLMYETAQPVHVYDYDKVKQLSGGQGAVLTIRHPKSGEKITVLGGKVIKPRPTDMMVAAGDHLVCVGGIMGGINSEVDEKTKNIIVEAANWDMNAIRKTMMAYGLFTDAATRFTKNQSPRQNRTVVAKAANDILEIAGGRVSGKLVDDQHFIADDKPVELTSDFINSRLGLELSVAEIKKLLENVEFKVATKGSRLIIVAPFWRTDIEIPEDIVEEVGRLYGYDHLPLQLPKRDLTPAKVDELLAFKSQLRGLLSAAGTNEVLTYSFVHDSLLQNAGQDLKATYHIRNALSPTLQHYRLSITPSLLEKVHPNIKAGFEQFAVYEIGKGHVKDLLDDEKLPKELERVSLVIASKTPRSGSAYYLAKKYCDYLLSELRIKNIRYEQRDSGTEPKTVTYYESSRAANIKIGDKVIGRIGEFREAVSQKFKLPKYCAGFDLHTDELLAATASVDYHPLNRFPSLDQDITLRASADLSYAQLTDYLEKKLTQAAKEHGYNWQIEPLNIFQRPEDKSHKQTTWRIIVWHPEKTLTTQEINDLLDKIAAEASKELKAERI